MKKFVSLLLGAVMSMSLCLPVLSACGETNEDGPHEHTVESWTQTKAPTCTEKGEESGVCTVCGETVTQSIDETGHTIDEKKRPPAPRTATMSCSAPSATRKSTSRSKPSATIG